MDADRPSPPDPVPNGLVLFAPGTPPAVRRRRRLFALVGVLITALILWPIYPLVAGVFPLVLGLPLALAWVVFALALMFANLVWLYRTESEGEGR